MSCVYRIIQPEKRGEDELLSGGLCSPSACLVVSLIPFSTYAYITYDDIKQLGNLKDQTVIVVKAPTDTKLEVTDPDEVCVPAQRSNAGGVWGESFNPHFKCSMPIYDGCTASLQSLSIHLTSTKGPIDVLLCPDDDSDPKSPVKNGGTDINGNSPFLKVLQGLLPTLSCSVELNIHPTN